MGLHRDRTKVRSYSFLFNVYLELFKCIGFNRANYFNTLFNVYYGNVVTPKNLSQLINVDRKAKKNKTTRIFVRTVWCAFYNRRNGILKYCLARWNSKSHVKHCRLSHHHPYRTRILLVWVSVVIQQRRLSQWQCYYNILKCIVRHMWVIKNWTSATTHALTVWHRINLSQYWVTLMPSAMLHSYSLNSQILFFGNTWPWIEPPICRVRGGSSSH